MTWRLLTCEGVTCCVRGMQGSGALDAPGPGRRARMCEAQCRGAIEFPGVGIGPRSSDEAANRMASEVRQSLRCSAESVLCLSKQPAHEVRVIELDEVVRETRISVASSRRCRIAAGDCEQNFALACRWPKYRSPRWTWVAGQASLRSNVPRTRSAGHSARCAEGPHRPRS